MNEHESSPNESESPIELFTVEDREAALQRLVAFGSQNREIVGTMLVGSGAEGFKDNYSDVDVVYVSEARQYQQVLDATKNFISQDLEPVFMTNYQHREDVEVLALLLENCLEIDIGVWSLPTLFASSSSWRIIQQRDPEAIKLIEEAMRTHPQLSREHDPVLSGDAPLWQPLHGRFMAQLRSHQEKLVKHQLALNANLIAINKEGQDLLLTVNDIFTAQQATFLKKLLSKTAG